MTMSTEDVVTDVKEDFLAKAVTSESAQKAGFRRLTASGSVNVYKKPAVTQ